MSPCVQESHPVSTDHVYKSVFLQCFKRIFFFFSLLHTSHPLWMCCFLLWDPHSVQYERIISNHCKCSIVCKSLFYSIIAIVAVHHSLCVLFASIELYIVSPCGIEAFLPSTMKGISKTARNLCGSFLILVIAYINHQNRYQGIDSTCPCEWIWSCIVDFGHVASFGDHSFLNRWQELRLCDKTSYPSPSSKSNFNKQTHWTMLMRMQHAVVWVLFGLAMHYLLYLICRCWPPVHFRTLVPYIVYDLKKWFGSPGWSSKFEKRIVWLFLASIEDLALEHEQKDWLTLRKHTLAIFGRASLQQKTGKTTFFGGRIYMPILSKTFWSK